MTNLKSIIFMFLITLAFTACNEQGTENKELASVDVSVEKQSVISVMRSYKDGIQALITDGLTQLFSEDSKIYESGGSEGSFANYLDHHLGPELDYFKSFEFSDYTIDVEVDMPYAFTTETYIYTIEIKANEEKEIEARTIIKKGVATSILKKINGQWKIIKTHSSSRENRKH